MSQPVLDNRPPFPEIIDSTMRKSLVACPYQYYIEYVRKLKPKGTNPHFHFGGLYAKGLETTRKSYWDKELSLSEAIRDGGMEILKGWNNYEPPDYGSAKNKTLEACLEIHSDYFREYHPEKDFLKPAKGDAGHTIEFSFAHPLPNIFHPVTGKPILYAGRFDMLAEHTKNKGIYFIDDEKTAGQLGDHWSKQFQLCGQMTGYQWGAEKFGYKIAGIVIRGVCVQKGAIRHLALLTQRSEWQITRWLDQVCRDVKRAIRMWEDMHFDLALDDACQNYGGCSLLGICTSENPETWLEADWEHNSWSPLAGDQV